MPSISRRNLLAGGFAASVFALSGCAPAASSPSTQSAAAGTKTVRVAVSSKIAYYLPYLMEEHWGEFGRQNIAIQMEYAPAPDTLMMLATGRVDAVVTGPSANIFNAVAGGSDIRMVAPGGVEDNASTNGWYASTKALGGQTFDVSMLKGKTLASSSGVSGPPLLTLSRELAKAGLDLNDITIKSLSSSDGLIALENGAVFGGTVSHPNTAVVAKAGSAKLFARSAPEGWPSVNVFFGPTLLTEDPDAGKAFIRGLRNTYVNHMQGDFMHSPENLEKIAAALEADVDVVKGIPSALYPTTMAFPADFLQSYEQTFRQIPGVLSYPDGQEMSSKILDTTYLDHANSSA